MGASDELRERTRATWAAGDWDGFSELLAPVGRHVLEQMAISSGQTLLDVGTGSGGTIAIPAARAGAAVTAVDITPELLEHARRRAQEAGVEVRWLEADAAELPFDDQSFDHVCSTFAAMFAPDHDRAAGELVRVCRAGGQIAMTTWTTDGFAGELFKLTGRYAPPPPPGAGTPVQWGEPDHVEETFAKAGAKVAIERAGVDFDFPSVEQAVARYTSDLGPCVMARAGLEPQGRWDPFVEEFEQLIRRFNPLQDGRARIHSEYLLITARRPAD
jgi:SAM-dependent methyltransferase